MSLGLSGMEVLSFGKVSYDTVDDKMKPIEKSRKSDFLSISGKCQETKMWKHT